MADLVPRYHCLESYFGQINLCVKEGSKGNHGFPLRVPFKGSKMRKIKRLIKKYKRIRGQSECFFEFDPPNEDGLWENGLILPRSQCDFMWYGSWFSLVSTVFALYNKHYDLALVPFGVFLTSINYWRNPVLGWSRILDISYVNLSMIYQCYRVSNAEYKIAYYSILGVALCFYPLSVFLHKKSPWLSTLSHFQLHLLGNISNCIVYSGTIP
jgi:hypothetical protein